MVASSPPAAQTGSGASNASEAPATQVGNEVDLFMQRVFENRHTSWRRLGDFILRELHTLDLEAPPEIPLSGFRREYEWYVRDGVAVRRPVRFNGVDIDEERRRDYEEEWLREERRRRVGRDGKDLEPRFISDTYYFTEFPFEPGSYYLADREIFLALSTPLLGLLAKSPNAPRWNIAMLWTAAVLMTLRALNVVILPIGNEGQPPLRGEELLSVIQTLSGMSGIVSVSLGWAVVWTEYFKNSVRVKNTFS